MILRMPRPKLQDARERLLAAGLAQFAQHGTERVNTNTIAKRARVGIGTFYSHFPDKYALLREIELRTLGGLRYAREQALAAASARDSQAQVRAVTAAAVDFASRHPAAYRVTFGRERVGSGHRGPVVSESTRGVEQGLRLLQARGAVAMDLDPALAARAYQAMETGLLLWWLEAKAPAEPTDVIDTLTRLHPASRPSP